MPPSWRCLLFSLPTVLVLAGGLDLSPSERIAAEYASLFPDPKLVVQPGAGHYPWVDDPAWFRSAVAGFLDSPE